MAVRWSLALCLSLLVRIPRKYGQEQNLTKQHGKLPSLSFIPGTNTNSPLNKMRRHDAV
jgi:hypothetical protein